MSPTTMKPIKVYGDYGSPNPCKVRIILEELEIPFEDELLTFADLKKDPYTSVNPNGRVPAIHDPNTGITLWESAAILTYLVETYDKNHKLSFDTIPEKHYVNQWLAFQVSGQGPYYGQFVWFLIVHPEHIVSAVERYEKEIERVRSVLDKHLAKTGSWLVGDRCTIADLSWVMWEHVADVVLTIRRIDLSGRYPAYDAWVQSMYQRPTVQKAIAGRKEHFAKTGLFDHLKAKAEQNGYEVPDYR